MGPYLFAHFTGEGPDGEQIHFAVSRDGLRWRDLNGGKPVLRSAIGTGGVRDPFLVRHPVRGWVILHLPDNGWVSQSLYGPVKYLYPILEKDTGCGVLGTGHHSILRIPGTNQYRIAYHRFATPMEKHPEGKGWHREVCTAPLYFGDDGRICPVDVTA